jgi:hypothetical protein
VEAPGIRIFQGWGSQEPQECLRRLRPQEEVRTRGRLLRRDHHRRRRTLPTRQRRHRFIIRCSHSLRLRDLVSISRVRGLRVGLHRRWQG